MRIHEVALEAYVQGAVIAELSPAMNESAVVSPAYQVQAILARTYAVANQTRHGRDGYALCATTHCQLYDPSRLRTSRWARVAIDAVAKTAGVVLWYDGGAARAVYHADCGGHTSAAASVWGGRDYPYLRGVADNGASAPAHSGWRYEVSVAALVGALNADPRTRVGDRLDSIQVLERDAAGRADVVALHGRREILIRGEELRDVLSRAFGPRAIRSTRVTISRSGSRFTFEGRGFGHGVGLCQTGALARLRGGDQPSTVLLHYFPGTTLRALE